MMKQIYRSLCVASVFFLLLGVTVAHAQSRTVTGKISDVSGQGIPGVNIIKKGTTTGSTTDANGVYSVEATNDDVLVVSFIGYVTEEAAVGNKTIIDVTLSEDIATLQEVVVVGYGTANRSDVSSSISSIKARDLRDLPVAGIDQAMQGKLAGVAITNNSGQPGGGVSIKVRGITSVNSNDPLFVIDGVLFTNNTRKNVGYDGLGGANGQTGNSVLSTINPNDIESIDVLKDASAQAIYGSQAANGVVIITTKKGKSGEGKMNYDVYYGEQRIARRLDLMNLREFAQYQNEIAPSAGITPTEEFKDVSLLGNGTDWQDAIFRTGKMQNHQLSFSGGKDKTTYYLSLNYFKQEGILIGSDLKRYTTRFNLDHQLNNWLNVGVSSNLTRSDQRVTLADQAEGTIWWSAIQSPVTPVVNQDGTWGGGNTISGVTYNQDNPVAMSNNRGNKLTNTSIFGQVYAELKLLKGLSLRNELAYRLGLNSSSAYQNQAVIGPRTQQSKLIDNRNDDYYYALRNYLSYNRTFSERHNVNATLGHDAQYSYYQSIGGTKTNLQENIKDLDAGSTDRTSWSLTGGKNNWAMESYYARIGYTYDQRYSISASYRADGSSNFGANNKWGYFPGISAGWTITNERFADPLKSFVNTLKLRAGWGKVGNQNLPDGAPNPPYTGGVRFWSGPVGFNQVGTASTNFLNGIPNPDLSWESVVTTNGGVDIEVLQGRVGLVVDIYKKTTTKMLLFSTGPALIGVGDAWDDLKAPIGNVGQMTNRGIDLAINTINVTGDNFSWRSNLIYSRYTNKLDKLINEASSIDGKIYYDNYTVTHTTPGYAVGSFYGLKTDGLFRTQEDLDNSLPQFGYTVDQQHTYLGDVRFKDVTPDGVIDAKDITYIGNPLPKFTYGFTNTFQYKNFDLSVFLQGSYGGKIFNFLKWQLEKMDNAYNNQSRSVKDRYTESNPNGSLPRFTNTNVNNSYISDRYIEDASYLRIQNVTLAYRLPQSLVKRAMMNSLRFYVSVQNLKTFSDYSGYDPEIGSFNNSIKLMNVDAGHYPNPRTFTIGANIEF